jgi:hypothetical protein
VINFRYHVVSLTAVFLALTIGLVLGTAALNGPVADDLNNRVNSLSKRNGQLREESQQLKNQVNSQADFVRESAPMLLAGRLAGRSVLVVTTDTADRKNRDAVLEMLRLSGATVTGNVRLDEPFTDPQREDALQDLATRLVPAGVKLPNNGEGVETAASLLAAALIVNPAGGSISEANRTGILAGFSSLGAATVEGNITRSADAVVLVAGQGATEVDADRRNAAHLTIVREFDRMAKYMVLAGPQEAGSPVAAIRGDDALAKDISTVDNVSSPEGQVATALVLAEQFGGKTGHYGAGDGATARVPALQKK